MVIVAMAMPKMMTTIADVRLRGAVNSTSGIMQQARMLSIKDATLYKVKFSNLASGSFMYVDKNDDGSIQTTELQVQMGSTILASSAPTGIAAGLSAENDHRDFAPVAECVSVNEASRITIAYVR